MGHNCTSSDEARTETVFTLCNTKREEEIDRENYRPVSLLSVASKILESEANDNLVYSSCLQQPAGSVGQTMGVWQMVIYRALIASTDGKLEKIG